MKMRTFWHKSRSKSPKIQQEKTGLISNRKLELKRIDTDAPQARAIIKHA